MSADPASNARHGRSARAALIVGGLAGVVLTLIGARFLLSPEAASRFFGVGPRPAGLELHGVVGLRDLWLGLLAVAFALQRDYRALALWLALGALVCLGDAAIVLKATAKPAAVAFHVGSGLICTLAAWACWRAAGRKDQK